MKKPDECNRCHFVTPNLEKFDKISPDYKSGWLCPYCSLMYSPEYDREDIKKTMSGLFNELEKRLINTLETRIYKGEYGE